MRESVGCVTPLTITTHAESDSDDRERGGGGVIVRDRAEHNMYTVQYTLHTLRVVEWEGRVIVRA